MKTVYTVSESDGSVEVCVNLTQPQVDILEEFVVVRVYDYIFSVHIPSNSTLASETVNIQCVGHFHCLSPFSSS